MIHKPSWISVVTAVHDDSNASFLGRSERFWLGFYSYLYHIENLDVQKKDIQPE